VRKPDDYSRVEGFETNPIKTSYQLLWAELARNPLPALTIQNTMRRILENYFKILGNIDTSIILSRFEGHEKVQCQSLISWVNDGSHYSPDELYVAISDGMTQSYMKIFFKVFKTMEHMPHYKMMMGRNFVDLDPDEGAAKDEDLMRNVGDAAIDADAAILVAGGPGTSAAVGPTSIHTSVVIPLVAPVPEAPSAGTADSESNSPF